MGILLARIPEWVAMPSSRGSSWPRNPTGVSCIADRFFTSWATREAPYIWDTSKRSRKRIYLFLTPFLLYTHTHTCTLIAHKLYSPNTLARLCLHSSSSGNSVGSGNLAFATVSGARDAAAHKTVPGKGAGYRRNSISWNLGVRGAYLEPKSKGLSTETRLGTYRD